MPRLHIPVWTASPDPVAHSPGYLDSVLVLPRWIWSLSFPGNVLALFGLACVAVLSVGVLLDVLEERVHVEDVRPSCISVYTPVPRAIHTPAPAPVPVIHKSRRIVIGARRRGLQVPLPVEVLAEIFVALNPGCPSFADLHRVMRVCSSWRTTALHEPRLWSHITVYYARKFPITHFDEYLRRSKDVPLRLFLGPWSTKNTDDFSGHLTLIVPQMHRVVSLALGPMQSNAALDALLIAPAPRLIAFTIEVRDSVVQTGNTAARTMWQLPHDLFDGDAPRLTELLCLPHQLPSEHAPALAGVTSFGRHDLRRWTRANALPTATDIANIAQCSPGLKTLILPTMRLPDISVPVSALRSLNTLYMPLLSGAWDEETRAGLLSTLEVLQCGRVGTILLWGLDGEAIRQALPRLVEAENGVQEFDHLEWSAVAGGGRLQFESSTRRNCTRVLLDIPRQDLSRLLRDAAMFAHVTRLSLPCYVSRDDLPFPRMPALTELCIVTVVGTVHLPPTTAMLLFNYSAGMATRTGSARLASSAIGQWTLPRLQSVLIIFPEIPANILGEGQNPHNGLVPKLSARDIVRFVQHELRFCAERLDSLRLSNNIVLEEGYTRAVMEKLEKLATRFEFLAH